MAWWWEAGFGAGWVLRAVGAAGTSWCPPGAPAGGLRVVVGLVLQRDADTAGQVLDGLGERGDVDLLDEVDDVAALERAAAGLVVALVAGV